MANNPLIDQGTLNRVRCSIIVASYPNLNITSGYMSKQSLARISFDGNFNEQIPTATGVVNSPEPYAMGSVAVNLLRTTALAAAWRAQWENTTIIGSITIYSDTAAFPAFTLRSSAIQHFDPNAFDGNDPASALMLRGVYDINTTLWSF